MNERTMEVPETIQEYANMDRRIVEADYILENLCRARQDVITHPEWYEPDALERIETAIASIHEARLVAEAA